MISVRCEGCNEVLKEPGGLLFSPPLKKVVDKLHLCVPCYVKVLCFVIRLGRKKKKK